jgi:hypothetical protein
MCRMPIKEKNVNDEPTHDSMRYASVKKSQTQPIEIFSGPRERDTFRRKALVATLPGAPMYQLWYLSIAIITSRYQIEVPNDITYAYAAHHSVISCN